MKQLFETSYKKPATVISPSAVPEEQPSQNPALHKLREIVRIRRSRRRTFVFVFCLSLGVFSVILSSLTEGMNSSDSSRIIIQVCLLFGGLTAFLFIAGLKDHVKAVKELADTTDPSAIGPLAEALTMREFELSGIKLTIEDTLIRLLAQLKPGDKLSLSDDEARALYSQLEGDHKEFVIAILQSLSVVPDTMALRFVEDLARGYGAARSRPEVRKLALALLRPLRDLCRVEDTNATLLRAADSQPTEDTLLRPASGASQPDSAALLRPTFAEEPPGNSPLVTLPEPGQPVSLGDSRL
jgi:hypothetical protein